VAERERAAAVKAKLARQRSRLERNAQAPND